MVIIWDPLKSINELAVILALALLGFALYKYRENVLLALTGDSKIHCGPLDCIWWTLRCGGRCSGDWTRVLTRHLICLPPKYRGINIVKYIGQCLGFATRAVEMKNLVVGDLPFSGHGDFFISVQCSNNPNMVTSLAEDKNPKVVHFPEILTLRMRHSPFAPKVRIVVKELNVLGFEELCECYISATNICDWASDEQEQIKRVEMKPLNLEFEADTPPWILVEFSEPTEVRDLDSLHGNTTTVRTATKTGDKKDRDIVNFKHRYNLVDTTGHAIAEPFEQDLRRIHMFRTIVVWIFGIINTLVSLTVVGYAIFRFYIYSCYRQFTAITIADLKHTSFPISDYHLHKLVLGCEHQFEGTGIDGVACRPTTDQIMDHCENVPYNQPRPSAFTHVVNEMFGTEIEGAKCFEGLCDFRAKLVEWDWTLALCCALLVLATFGLRYCLNECIRIEKSSNQRSRAEELKQSRKHQTTASGYPLIDEDLTP